MKNNLDSKELLELQHNDKIMKIINKIKAKVIIYNGLTNASPTCAKGMAYEIGCDVITQINAIMTLDMQRPWLADREERKQQ